MAVRLDPFQNIIAVHWRRGLIATMIFRHEKSDEPTSANSKKTHVELVAPDRDTVVGWSTASASDRGDPASGVSGLGVGVPTETQLLNHYVWYGGWAASDLELTATDETYFVNLQKLLDDFSTEESPLTEIRLRLAVAKVSGVEGPIALLCRGYESLTFTLDPPPFPPTFHSPGPEIATMSADSSVSVSEGLITDPPTVIGELIINLTTLTAGFVIS